MPSPGKRESSRRRERGARRRRGVPDSPSGMCPSRVSAFSPVRLGMAAAAAAQTSVLSSFWALSSRRVSCVSAPRQRRSSLSRKTHSPSRASSSVAAAGARAASMPPAPGPSPAPGAPPPLASNDCRLGQRATSAARTGDSRRLL
jgi:hypothetical protein